MRQGCASYRTWDSLVQDDCIHKGHAVQPQGQQRAAVLVLSQGLVPLKRVCAKPA
jgi:hypothetical protein